jgi:peptidyl-prolyl cis-trans isomerase B (cyclophilin B)
MVQTGDPTGTGSGGESIWGQPFGLEASFNLRHFRGALAMAHSGGEMGSQFYIVQAPRLSPSYVDDFRDLIEQQDLYVGSFRNGDEFLLRQIHPPEAYEHFLETGGTPHLDWLYGNPQGHTVFGHVVSGIEIVDAIANTPRDRLNDRPDEDIIITRVSFIIHEG